MAGAPLAPPFTASISIPTMVRIGLMNLLLHGVDEPNLHYRDTLSKKFDEKERYDVVLANPPFKGSINESDIHEDLRLDSQKDYDFSSSTGSSTFSRIGGRAGVIVPDGVLFGSSNAHRDLGWRPRRMRTPGHRLDAHPGVFKPYAGVSTAVHDFHQEAAAKVWFYDIEADGYSLDDKRERISDSDIPDVINRWKARDSEPPRGQER